MSPDKGAKEAVGTLATAVGAKKAHEKKVLDDVLTFCQNMGGYRKKAAKKLSVSTVTQQERPDFAIEKENGDIVGLEHFRVDHHIEGGNKAKSRSAKLDADIKKMQENIVEIADENVRHRATIESIAEILSKEIYQLSLACCDDLCRSLQRALFDSQKGHAHKAADYRRSLEEKFGGGKSIALGYLIEIHSDFRGLWLHKAGRTQRLELGQCPLFENMFDFLLRASSDVEWLLIGFYPTQGSGIIDAAIIDCRNGGFKANCQRQGLERTAYCGLGKTSPFRKQKKIDENPVLHDDGDSVQICVDNTAEDIDPKVLWSDSMKSAAVALNCYRSKKPFVATVSIEMLFEALNVESKKITGPLDASKVQELLSNLPPGRLEASAEAFGKRNGFGES